MSTPEATIHLTAERSREWQDSFDDLFKGVVHLEEMEEPRGLATYLDGYSDEFDFYNSSLSDRERSELNHYLGGTGPYRHNKWGDDLKVRHRHKHPVHSEIRKPFRYLRREVAIGPIDEFNPDIELPDDLHIRAAEHRFDGALHANHQGRTYIFSKEDPVYEISVYSPPAERRMLSFALAFYPARQRLTLARIALHPRYFADYPPRIVEPMFEDLLELFHTEKDTDSMTVRKGRVAVANQVDVE